MVLMPDEDREGGIRRATVAAVRAVKTTSLLANMVPSFRRLLKMNVDVDRS